MNDIERCSTLPSLLNFHLAADSIPLNPSMRLVPKLTRQHRTEDPRMEKPFFILPPIQSEVHAELNYTLGPPSTAYPVDSPPSPTEKTPKNSMHCHSVPSPKIEKQRKTKPNQFSVLIMERGGTHTLEEVTFDKNNKPHKMKWSNIKM